MAQSRLYKKGKLVESNFPFEDISRIQKSTSDFYWFDFVDPTEAELAELGKELGLNKLALADALNGKQRPKLEHYDSHIFINAYAANFDTKTRDLNNEEISIFVTKNGLITVRDNNDFDMSAVTKNWDDGAELALNGVSFLLWGLLDVIVDTYFVAVEQLDAEIEDLEELMFAAKRTELNIQERSYDLRKALVVLRRIATPMREVITPLLRNDNKILNSAMFTYYQDIFDHVMRVSDWTESLRDLITTLLETNLTIQSNNMNLIMKKVTSWAAIIAVPTAITGFYGQNIPYPGFGADWGFWFSTGAIVVMSGGLYWAFKRNDWL
ncbi:MAG: magnesium and cobalt transporter CorA [Actinomycetota bacterium]